MNIDARTRSGQRSDDEMSRASDIIRKKYQLLSASMNQYEMKTPRDEEKISDKAKPLKRSPVRNLNAYKRV